MAALDRAALLAEIAGGIDCELRHREPAQATDILVVPFGTSDGPVETVKRELVIPICAECAEALQGEEWTLLYCFECGESRWVHRASAKLKYQHHILWLRGCPECGEFGGLYFAEDGRFDLLHGACLPEV